MISPLTITSLNQGMLYGEKPTIEELDAHGAIIHERELGAPAQKLWDLLVREPLAWRDLFAQLATKARG